MILCRYLQINEKKLHGNVLDCLLLELIPRLIVQFVENVTLVVYDGFVIVMDDFHF